ncbi:MAG: glutamate 5-kinase, partial [Anaerolineae bacterium]|nr:glutamate 5-kinase [Anaerolineae bacterium]
GRELARGIARYNSQDMAKIAGHHSDKVAEILGYAYGPVVVHRNDMILL